MKYPLPDPFRDFEFCVVGLGELDQQKPLTVTGNPPSLVILPIKIFSPYVNSVVKVGKAYTVTNVT